MAMKARVKLVCPVCDLDLSCIVIDRDEHPNKWVLSIPSRKHLEDRACKKTINSEELAVGAVA
jgi:hypothetical protein